MFKLRGWDYKKFSVARPPIVGKYTLDLVYARIAPGVLKQLLELEPKNERGRRKHHLHRWFTDDIGHPELAKHIFAVETLMRANTSWDKFYRLMQRALPKQNANLELNLTDKEGEPLSSGSGVAMSENDDRVAPEFAHFREYGGLGADGFFIDFLGVRTRVSYFDESHQWLSGRVFPYPTSKACIFFEYYEWIGALRSVLEARNQIVVVELGAGWAPWLVSMRAAALQVGISECHLLGVEALKEQCGFARQHFADNAVPENERAILRGTIGVGAGDLSIKGVIKDFDRVDLIHCDIQGAEADAFEASMRDVSSRVARVVIGTHSRGIEEQLFSLFGRNKWALEFETACRNVIIDGTPRLHSDGVQVWKNTRLL